MSDGLPPPRRPSPPSPLNPLPPVVSSASPTHRTRKSKVLPWVLGTVVVLLSVGAIVIFTAGEFLTGSDPGTIDSYNREVLDSCEVPAGSTLVQTSIRPVFDGTGQRYRSMWYVYASPLTADVASEFFGVTTGVSTPVSPERACHLGQRPSAMVLSSSVAGEPIAIDPGVDREAVPDVSYDGLWADQAADVVTSADTPVGTRSFFRLRLAQREVAGVFGVIGPMSNQP
jgi:hypothetical protein